MKKIVISILGVVSIFSVALGSVGSLGSFDQNEMYRSKTEYKWSVSSSYYLVYRNNLFSTMFADKLNNAGATAISLTASYRLDEEDGLSELFRFLDATVEPTIGINYWSEKNRSIPEGDIYLNFRWTDFPWNHKIATTLSIGEGFSYVAAIPEVEQAKVDGNITKRFLNLLLFEVTLANPNYPELQYVFSLHHRSGAFGLYDGAKYTDSNMLGLGFRYYFK